MRRLAVVFALVVRRDPLPPTLEAAGTNPLWAQMITLAVVVAVWFLAGPAFARTAPETRRRCCEFNDTPSLALRPI